MTRMFQIPLWEVPKERIIFAFWPAIKSPNYYFLVCKQHATSSSTSSMIEGSL